MEYTPNKQLYKWSLTDTKRTTIIEMAKNADKLDEAFAQIDEKTNALSSDLADIVTNVKTQADIQKALDKNVNVTLNVSGQVDITSNLTLPNRVKLVFNNGGKLFVKTGVTLTVNCPIEAGFFQIFDYEDDTSAVTTYNTSETWIDRPSVYNSIKLDWFGAKGNAYFNWDTHSVYSGNDDTKAIKRAMSFVTKASQKYKAGYLTMTSIVVEARPSASYYVQGDNILGCQDSSLSGVCFEFRGNGSVFYHKPLTTTDAFINNFGKIYRPNFRDFDVLPFGTVGRIGKFVHSSEVSAIGNQGRFDNIIVGQLNYQCGYDVIFNIVSSVMVDNVMHQNCQYMNCNKIYYNTNVEAMGWVFEKCYLAVCTDNGTFFHSNCNLGGGFEIRNCEVLFMGAGQTFFKLQNQSNYEQFKIEARIERQTSNMVFLDIDGGFVEVKGINMVNASGGQTTSSVLTAIIKNLGFARFTDSFLSENVRIETSQGVPSGYDKSLEFINCNFIDNAGNRQQYPVLSFIKPDATIIDKATMLNSIYTHRKVSVLPYIGKQADGVVLPIEYGGNTRNNFHVDLTQNNSGKIIANTNNIILPSYILIKSLKVVQYEKNLANVNKIKFEFFASGGGAAEYTWTIDLSTYTRGQNTLDGYCITIPSSKYMKITYMLDTTVVTTLANIPNSYIEMDYINMQSNLEYANREYSSAIALN